MSVPSTRDGGLGDALHSSPETDDGGCVCGQRCSGMELVAPTLPADGLRRSRVTPGTRGTAARTASEPGPVPFPLRRLLSAALLGDHGSCGCLGGSPGLGEERAALRARRRAEDRPPPSPEQSEPTRASAAVRVTFHRDTLTASWDRS